MEIVFIGDNLSIHQKPLCDELFSRTNGRFHFISTKPITEERLKMGWQVFDDSSSYAIKYNEENKAKVMSLIEKADALIVGAADISFVKKSIKKGKLVFKYQERLLKKGISQIFSVKFLYSFFRTFLLNQKKNFHLLAASAYCKSDFDKFFCFKNRSWKWGYFINPICNEYQKRQNDVPKIIWVGRFLNWKHCEMVISAAKALKEKNIFAEFTIVGSGVEQENLFELANKYDVNDTVSFIGNIPNNEVHMLMKTSDICLVTSDCFEGWGVVVNEALSAGCCVIAADCIGSAPFLINNGINGLLFKGQDQFDLNRQLIYAIENKDSREFFGRKAIEQMKGVWSAENAAESFVALVNYLSGNGESIKNGPCSPA